MHKDGFDITVWTEDRPMTQLELINRAKQNNALLCTVTEKMINYS